MKAIIPCDHPDHDQFDGATYDYGWDPAAYCNPPYPFGSRRNHTGAEVIELTQRFWPDGSYRWCGPKEPGKQVEPVLPDVYEEEDTE